MKKLVLALALVVATCGAFAQTTPTQPKHSITAKPAVHKHKKAAHKMKKAHKKGAASKKAL